MKHAIHGTKLLLILISLTIIIVTATEAYRFYFADKPENDTNFIPKQDILENNNLQDSQNQSLPESALIQVPFLVQAPNANWDELHEEACEETSLIMVNHFLKKTSISSPESGETEILDLVSWENQNEYKVDVTISELNDIAKKYFGIKTGRIKTNATINDIKSEISAGRPVIVPAAGKILPNPNFRSGGPLYHMLVIKGYDKNGFITNDPGTKLGEGFRYKFEDLYNAIHDWDPEDIMKGDKNYLVFD